jgi:hypothetical protein
MKPASSGNTALVFRARWRSDFGYGMKRVGTSSWFDGIFTGALDWHCQDEEPIEGCPVE